MSDLHVIDSLVSIGTQSIYLWLHRVVHYRQHFSTHHFLELSECLFLLDQKRVPLRLYQLAREISSDPVTKGVVPAEVMDFQNQGFER